jgi:3',5'-cyclic AMP phosphodiesterase CpdA
MSSKDQLPVWSRRDFVTALGAFFASQILLPKVLGGVELPSGLKPIRLGFLTDCHAMDEHDASAWLDRTAELMNSLNPDLIIGGGDFVHGGFQSPGKEMEHRWVLADTFLKKLKTRLEPLIGNHDFYEPLLADKTPSPGDPRWRWRQHFGLEHTYRSFPWNGYRFLMLDSVKVVGGKEPYQGWIDEEQLAWLEHELATIPLNEPIILCTHIPFQTLVSGSLGGLVGPSPGRVSVLNANLVMEKLRNRPVAAILQGHVHMNERLELNGVPCITGGAVCGKWWQGPNMNTYPGVGVIEITPIDSQLQKGGAGQNVVWSYSNTPAPERVAPKVTI